MTNYNNLWCFGICEDSLYKFSYICKVLSRMVNRFCSVGISISPCCCVKLSFFVTFGHKVSCKTSESSLPFCITICGSSSKGDITISMDKNYWNFDDFLCRVFLTTKRAAFYVSSVVWIWIVAYLLENICYHFVSRNWWNHLLIRSQESLGDFIVKGWLNVRWN